MDHRSTIRRATESKDAWFIRTFIYNSLGFVVFVVVCMGVVASVLGVGITAINRQLTVESCRNWAIKTDRVSKFASYNYFNFQCLTKAVDGKWVSINNPQQFVPMHVSLTK